GYHFAHDVVREVVEADLGPGWRRVLHRRGAEGLAAAEGALPMEALAYHYIRAGIPDQVVLYLEREGDRAHAPAAPAPAQGCYQDVVERVDKLGRVQEAARAREKLGAVLATMGRYDAALAALEQVAETARAAGDLDSLGRVTAQRGWTHAERGTPQEGVA